MPRPTLEIEGCAAAHSALIDTVAGLDEAALALHSRLPDWTVAPVLGHLVGNARSVVRRMNAVAGDLVVDQYPGGQDGRRREIDELARLPYGLLVEAVGRSCAEVEAALDAVPDDAWDRVSRSAFPADSPGRNSCGSKYLRVTRVVEESTTTDQPGEPP